MLDVLFGGLEVSSVAWKSLIDRGLKISILPIVYTTEIFSLFYQNLELDSVPDPTKSLDSGSNEYGSEKLITT